MEVTPKKREINVVSYKYKQEARKINGIFCFEEFIKIKKYRGINYVSK